MRTPTRTIFLVAMAALAALTLAACGDDGSSADDAGTTAPTVRNAWARTSAAGQTAGAAYMEIVGGSIDDALRSASVPASIAGTVEVHETTAAGTGAMSGATGTGAMSGAMSGATGTGAMSGSTGTGAMSGAMSGATGTGAMSGSTGMMTMRPVDQIAIPAGKTVVLEPGGYHVMLLDLPKPLATGDRFTVTLTFEKAGRVDVPVEVRAS